MSDPGPVTGVGAVVLAAGASTRLGTPKQTLRFQGESLLRRAASAALGAGCAPVVVVTGAHIALVRPELEGLPVAECWNPDWESGMASSIRSGLGMLLQMCPEVRHAALLVSDQPLVTPTLISRLVAQHFRSGKLVTASAYGGTTGVPAIFSRETFTDLLQLEGTAGAKRVLQQHALRLHAMPFPEGEWDIDVPEDVAKLSESPRLQ